MNVIQAAINEMCFLCEICWHQKCKTLRDRGSVMSLANDSQGDNNVMDAVYRFARGARC